MALEPTVYIVDDDPSLRRVLGLLLHEERLASRSFASAHEFLAHYDGEPGCLLLDVRMPQTSGLELQDQLTRRGVQIPIIFMSAYADVPMSVRAMKAGAVDFAEKPFDEHELLEAIHRALALDRRTRQTSDERGEAERRVRELTAREREVLGQVVAGKTNREIAAQWGISEKTVKIHRGRVMQKMQAGSLAELVLLAQDAGISRPRPAPR